MKKKDFQSIADRLAKQCLWDRAAYVGEWNNFAVYRSQLDGDGLQCIGFPDYFLFDAGGDEGEVMIDILGDLASGQFLTCCGETHDVGKHDGGELAGL